MLLDDGAPVDVFHDTGYIAAAKPLPYLPNIRTIADRTVPQETEAAPPEPAPAPAPVRRGQISATRQLGHFLALRRADCPSPYIPILASLSMPRRPVKALRLLISTNGEAHPA